MTGLHLSHRSEELSGILLLLAGPHGLALAGPQDGDLLAGGVGGRLSGCTLEQAAKSFRCVTGSDFKFNLSSQPSTSAKVNLG